MKSALDILKEINENRDIIEKQLLNVPNYKDNISIVERTCRTLNSLLQQLKNKQAIDSEDNDIPDQPLINAPDWIDHIETVEATCRSMNSLLFRLKKKKYLLDFGQREDDIYVATYPKSGTTWMQMILYQLTTDGNMDFEHINDVSPWIHWAVLKNKSVNDVPSPRIIKIHDTYDEMAYVKKGRFIYVVRNGMDVMNTLTYHLRAYGEPDISFDDVFETRLESWSSHVSSWIENRKGLNIFYIRYEDLKEDIEQEIHRIIHFCDMDVDDETIKRAIERSSFSFMKQYETKFGEQPERFKVYDQFIRKGKTGEGIQRCSKDQIESYRDLFEKHFKGSELMEPYRCSL